MKVHTRDAFPIECLQTGGNLGKIAFEEGNWQLAIDAYKNAIEAVEISRSWAMTLQSKKDVMETAINVYYKIVLAYLNTKQTLQALEYAERSKARNLVELITSRDLKPKGDFSPDILTELKRLRNRIRNEKIRLANEETKYNYNATSESDRSSQTSPVDRTHLRQLQQELDEFIQRHISPIDPSFTLTQKIESITSSEIESLIDDRTAIVEWYITGDEIIAFIITSGDDGKIIPWRSSSSDRTNLGNWVNEYLETYYSNFQEWKSELTNRLKNLGSILHLDEIISLLPKKCDSLILIPHRFLHLLPLHAVSVRRENSENAKSLLELFPRGVKYAPSCQLLKLSQTQKGQQLQNLFAIQDPEDNLIFTNIEVEKIASLFPNPSILAKQAATKDAIKNYPNFSSVHCCHFSCHGKFNLKSPLESALILANGENWTLGEIFELYLPQCHLVTLSACETGSIDFTSFSDEYIGLASGFIYAGSPNVVSSLWNVEDLSTSFLTIAFYQNLPSCNNNVAIALNKAQLWLRDITKTELVEWIEINKIPLDKLDPTQRSFFDRILYKMQDSDRPFENPYYWAAFCAIGK